MGCDKNDEKCMWRGGLLNGSQFDAATKVLIERDLNKYCRSGDPNVYERCVGYRIQERFLKKRR